MWAEAWSKAGAMNGQGARVPARDASQSGGGLYRDAGNLREAGYRRARQNGGAQPCTTIYTGVSR